MVKLKCEFLHYEVAWFSSDGYRFKEYFEDIKNVMFFCNGLKRQNIEPVIYQLSRVKEWDK